MRDVLAAIILGVVQGVTEFLPVSSSGHLLIAESLLGYKGTDLYFEVLLHFSTLLSIIVFFWSRLKKMRYKEWKKIFIACLPILIIGFVLTQLEKTVTYFNNRVVIIMLIVSGLINLICAFYTKSKMYIGNKKINVKLGFLVGLFQVFAIVPGISRSAVTMSAFLIKNVNKDRAFEFSFFMSIPVILIATLYTFFQIQMNGQIIAKFSLNIYLLSMVVAFITGFISLKFLKFVIKKSRFEIFALWCFIVALASYLVIDL